MAYNPEAMFGLKHHVVPEHGSPVRVFTPRPEPKVQPAKPRTHKPFSVSVVHGDFQQVYYADTQQEADTVAVHATMAGFLAFQPKPAKKSQKPPSKR